MTTISRHLVHTTATILEGETTSSRVVNREFAILALMTPADFEGTVLTFEASVDGSSFFELQDELGLAALAIPVVPQRAYPMPVELAPFPWFRVVSNEVVAADRVLRIVLKS